MKLKWEKLYREDLYIKFLNKLGFVARNSWTNVLENIYLIFDNKLVRNKERGENLR
ncbi:hypothetical protein [Clostridium sp. B9]|uniref:hypothetical protein n=1 Tax=Clostridium sp. B9 TaxID=3423224 RepID=UPI003D2F199B